MGMVDEFGADAVKISVFEIELSLCSKDFLLVEASGEAVFISPFSTIWSRDRVTFSSVFPSGCGCFGRCWCL